MSDKSEVTRDDRLAAYQAARGVDAPEDGTKAERWVTDGIGDYRDWQRVAQAIATARAASSAEVTRLQAELSELRANRDMWKTECRNYEQKQLMTPRQQLQIAWREGLAAGQHTCGLGEDDDMPTSPYGGAPGATNAELEAAYRAIHESWRFPLDGEKRGAASVGFSRIEAALGLKKGDTNG